jgi:monolysocardiolipin acyltransferase
MLWMVASAARLWMTKLNTLNLHGREHWYRAREHGRGLLTFSNHVSLFDDPLLTACFASHDVRTTRWISADALNFFGDPVRAAIFNTGKAVPIVRGVGLDQPGMHFLADRLRDGEWVHVFPEGGRTREAGAALRLPMKPGLAHLVRDAKPMLLPFRHWGMERVLPIGATVPRRGQQVDVVFGPGVDGAELADWSVAQITDWVEDTLLDLHLPNAAPRVPRITATGA